MSLSRTWRHLLATRWSLRRAFNASVLTAIEDAIRTTESTHGGEVRVAVENELEFPALWRGVTSRDRALEAFSQLRVWDTELNNGVLIYVLWADRRVEIVADRAFKTLVSDQEWRDVCASMEAAFSAHRPGDALVSGIQAVGALIARHFPATDRNELPDRPVLM
ncbi:MAG: TPM domain-containing protein [Povalibacter sp.]